LVREEKVTLVGFGIFQATLEKEIEPAREAKQP
jgi:nucleoid DNA-binding protein